MLVALISKYYISKITLPDIVYGNYWLTDKENSNKNLINIEGRDGEWQIQERPFFKNC